MVIVIAAGGTGGHIFPALAVAEALQQRNKAVKIVFLGTGAEVERKLIAGAGFELHALPFAKIRGAGWKGALSFLAAFPRALQQALSIYRALNPALVLGFGGYPAVIPLIGARLKGIPVFLHEQNVEPGLANKFLSLLAERLYAVPGAENFWNKRRLTHLPNPVREVFTSVPAWQPPASGQPFTLLIVGGSQGAVTLNTALLAILGELKKLNVRILHQTGALDYERVQKAYADEDYAESEPFAFTNNIAAFYARAHLVVCRAGAMTAAEVSAAGRPAIYVPLRIAAGHQAENVRALVQAGAARMLEQDEDLAVRLAAELTALRNSPEVLAEMAEKARQSAFAGKITAAQELADAVLERAVQFAGGKEL